MKRAARFLFRFLILFAVLPSALGTAIGYARGWPANWRVANWSSSHLLPEAAQFPEARVLILASRTGRWKGIFAEHMSIVMKDRGGSWVRYDVVGWGQPVRRGAYAADAFWYGNRPRIVFDVEGDEAASLIPRITASIKKYPFSQTGSYTVWPGPNSNTFVAWVVRNTEGFNAELPPVAVGKDWLGAWGIAQAPSHTGYSASIAGVLGATLAWEEGIELHLLGSTIGVDVNDLAIKLPAFGKLGLI